MERKKGYRAVEDCIFCKIARGEIPSKKVYEDDDVIAFFDVSPQAKKHILVIPRIHMEDALVCHSHSPSLLTKLLDTAIEVAKNEGLSETGFRIATNTGADAKQSIRHLHFHVLGGGPLSERIG